jgi:hypothetical protein
MQNHANDCPQNLNQRVQGSSPCAPTTELNGLNRAGALIPVRSRALNGTREQTIHEVGDCRRSTKESAVCLIARNLSIV